MPVHIENFSFGSMQIYVRVYNFDLVVDRGEIRKRKKKASRHYRNACGHMPVSVEEVWDSKSTLRVSPGVH